MKRYCKDTGKESFRSRGEAERALRNMNKWTKEAGSVYFCKACQGFHLTHFSYRYGRNMRTKKASLKTIKMLQNMRDNAWDNNWDNRDNTASIVPRKRRKRGIMDNKERNIIPAIVPKPNCSKSNK